MLGAGSFSSSKELWVTLHCCVHCNCETLALQDEIALLHSLHVVCTELLKVNCGADEEGFVFASSLAVCQDFSLLAWRILAVVTTAMAPVLYSHSF